jgi:23S rRNA (cytidine1920-2'-O)/16S rRNA (cytidine1409-2'-O)-methyltransferase
MRRRSGASSVKKRLDVWLAEKGLAPSREKAKAFVLGGKVTVDGCRVDKAGRLVGPDSLVVVSAPLSNFVGRGGDKLAGALDRFEVDLENKVAIDVGASTGGFTDCLLQRGAARVYAVDVGYGQLAWKLQQDSRVVRLDRVNIRTAARDLIPEECDLAVIDTSFISLRLVLPAAVGFLVSDGDVVALVKPQFEVGKGKVGKGGIVRDPLLHREVLLGMVGFASEAGLDVRGWMESPLRGADGNYEFFLYLKRGGGSGDGREQIEEEIRSWNPPDS